MCFTLQNQQALFRFLSFYSTDNLARVGRDKLIYGLIIINYWGLSGPYADICLFWQHTHGKQFNLIDHILFPQTAFGYPFKYWAEHWNKGDLPDIRHCFKITAHSKPHKANTPKARSSAPWCNPQPFVKEWNQSTDQSPAQLWRTCTALLARFIGDKQRKSLDPFRCDTELLYSQYRRKVCDAGWKQPQQWGILEKR